MFFWRARVKHAPIEIWENEEEKRVRARGQVNRHRVKNFVFAVLILCNFLIPLQAINVILLRSFHVMVIHHDAGKTD